MKKNNKSQKTVKGMPTAVVISILIHVGLFLLAGVFVVFTVVKQKEVEFAPPKAVERPKMKLKKPKVKVKKSAKPKPTTRIVTKVQKASMPDIQLPEMSGMAAGLEGGIGGFDLMPDFKEEGLFGGEQSVGNDFVGTYYDFNRDRSGRPIPASIETFIDKVADFVRHGWKDSDLARYYHSPKKLYATSFMVPPVLAMVAPEAFGEYDTESTLWLVHYKGQLVYPEDITIRFWGEADDIIVVRVNGELVLAGNFYTAYWSVQPIGGFWMSSAKNNRRFYLGSGLSAVGDWITLKAGEPQEMEVLIGEGPGGGFEAMLLVEVQGVEYPENKQGGPILPMFKTAETSLSLRDAIYRDLVEGEASIMGGPIFRDYKIPEKVADSTPEKKDVSSPDAIHLPVQDDPVRTWTFSNGKKLNAEYVTTIGNQAVLKNTKGKQLKIPMEQLSSADLDFIDLASPPTLKIDFSRSEKRRVPNEGNYLTGRDMKITQYVFNAKVKQISAGNYNHELKIEFFAIGQESAGNNYVLLDRQEARFHLSKENDYRFSLKGNMVETVDLVQYGIRRGIRYSGGYLVIITDERGKIIQYKSTSPWMFESLENLRNLPLKAYMDKTGTRVAPTRPKPVLY